MIVRKATIIAASILSLLVFIRINGDAAEFIRSIKAGEIRTTMAATSLTEEEKRKLFETITAEAEIRLIAPINARIDRVWHAIPGYNGIAVDIQRTYDAALRAPRGSVIQYLYKEVEPEIGLGHLGPHPIYRGNPSKKMISLMINVAWGNEYIEPILKTLKQEEVLATFFLDGSWLKKYPEVAKLIQADGHELSNHAYSHPDMRALSRQDQYTQISKTEQLLKDILGVQNNWFAPPSGAYNSATVQIAEEQGLKTVLWTIDTVDWQKPPAASVINKISSKLEPGALILMHPTETTRDALSGIIASAKAKGYGIGTVSDTLSSARKTSHVEGVDLF